MFHVEHEGAGVFLGKPFFVAKERFPQAPSKKPALDIARRRKINLRASGAKNKI